MGNGGVEALVEAADTRGEAVDEEMAPRKIEVEEMKEAMLSKKREELATKPAPSFWDASALGLLKQALIGSANAHGWVTAEFVVCIRGAVALISGPLCTSRRICLSDSECPHMCSGSIITWTHFTHDMVTQQLCKLR